MTNSPHRGDRRPAAVPQQVWRAGRMRAPGRLLVILACGPGESERLHQAWVGQAIDVVDCPNLAVALVRIGQSGADMVIVGEPGGVLGPVDFLTALRHVDTTTPVIVGLLEDCLELGSAALAAGATAVVRRPFAPGSVLRLLDSTTPTGSFQVRPLPIDLGRLKVDGAATRIWLDGVELIIPAMEFLLLRYLAERHGEIVSRAELLSAGWGDKDAVPNNHLNVHLARIRRRFPDDSG
ncbi:MAG: winged helix-turn-helix domain-containing protein, partial [Nakamurella sp.]